MERDILNSIPQSGGVGSHLVIMVDDNSEEAPLMVRGSLIIAIFEVLRSERGESTLLDAIEEAERKTGVILSNATKRGWYPISALEAVLEHLSGLPKGDYSWARVIMYKGIMESQDPSLQYLVENSGMRALLGEMSETWPSFMSHGSVRSFEAEKGVWVAGDEGRFAVRRRSFVVRLLYVQERARLACSIMIGMLEGLIHRTCGTRPEIKELSCIGWEDVMCEYEVTV